MATEGTTGFQATAEELQQQLGPQIEQVKARLDTYNQQALAFIKEKPGTALIGAIAAGYIIGRLVSRR